jgi:hypothetical protein
MRPSYFALMRVAFLFALILWAGFVIIVRATW